MSTAPVASATSPRSDRRMPRPARRVSPLVAIVGLVVLAASTIGCGTGGAAGPAPADRPGSTTVDAPAASITSVVTDGPTPAGPPLDAADQELGPDTLLGFIATPVGDPVVVAAPDRDAEQIEVAGTSPLGAHAVFAVVGDPTEAAGRSGEWIQVVLPTRPNEGTGWVAADSVAISKTPVRVSIDLAARTLTVTDDGRPVLEAAIAVGTDENPTPVGASFVTEVVETPNPAGAYGPYALGLALHSDTLTEFGGGPGQVGIHGTNRPDRIGDAVSHGCVRLANEDIAALVDLGLPLGTPVLIG